jgi:hypothetical protein
VAIVTATVLGHDHDGHPQHNDGEAPQVHGFLELLPPLLHTQLCEHVGDEPDDGMPRLHHLPCVPDLQPLGENSPRVGDDASEKQQAGRGWRSHALHLGEVGCQASRRDAEQQRGPYEASEQGNQHAPHLIAAATRDEASGGGLKEEEWSSFLIFSMERIGEELLVGGGGEVGEVSGSTFSWVQEAREEVTAGVAPGVGAKFHGVAKAS